MFGEMQNESNKHGNIRADESALQQAPTVPYHQRIAWLISNCGRSIPQHKFNALYEFMFKEVFDPQKFGPFHTLSEVVASDHHLYRHVDKDGRAVIGHKKLLNHRGSASDSIENYYHPPKWSLSYQNLNQIKYEQSFTLNIYKNDECIRNLNLIKLIEKFNQTSTNSSKFRSFVAFGRDNSVDYYMCHPTISRKHCIFQFANCYHSLTNSTRMDGIGGVKLCLYDLSGRTFINGKLVPKEEFIELKHHDNIKFGDSTRVYKLSIESSNNVNNTGGDLWHNQQEFIDSSKENRNPQTKQKPLDPQLSSLQNQMQQMAVGANKNSQNEMMKNHLNDAQEQSPQQQSPPQKTSEIDKEDRVQRQKGGSQSRGRKRRPSRIMFENDSNDSDAERENSEKNEVEHKTSGKPEESESESESVTDNENNGTSSDNDVEPSKFAESSKEVLGQSVGRCNGNKAVSSGINRSARGARRVSSLQMLPHTRVRLGGGKHTKQTKAVKKCENKRKFVVKGINFLDYVDNLSKLTVVKLKYYTEANAIHVGRVKKAELVKIIQKDLEKHM